MLYVKTRFVLILKAMSFSNLFGITLNFSIKLSNFLHYQITVTFLRIMKYYKSFINQFKISITTQMSKPLYFPATRS